MIDGTIAPTLPTGQAGFRSGIENDFFFWL